MNELKPLPEVSRELAAIDVALGKPVPNYRKLWAFILDGQIPAEQRKGRYHADAEIVAKTLGVIPNVDAQ